MLLFVLAAPTPFVIGLPALGWLHLVALGWLTMTALSVLIHVIPTFTEISWKGERLARGSLLLYALGVMALVTAFWNECVWALPWAGSIVALALVGFLIPSARTLVAALAYARLEAAIARALSITLTCLLIAVLIGVALAWALAGRGSASLLSLGPPIHASFGLIGWLTVLVMGVSTRTVRPITGGGSHRGWVHIAAGSLELIGMVGLVAGLALRTPIVEWTGAIVVVLGAILYVGDLSDVLRRATISHRPPQAFLGAAAVWLIVGLALGMSMLAGRPWGAAALYVLLVGWIGQMSNGHLHHIGIRLIATMARGDEDDTQPGDLLASPLSWGSFAFFQAAVAGGGMALMLGVPHLLAAAALSGLSGSCW